MSQTAELHVQTAVWTQDEWRFAVLILEGEAPGRASGGQTRLDGLFTAVRARSLPLTTDPDQVPLRPRPGWWLRIDESHAITVELPHFTPLLSAAPDSTCGCEVTVTRGAPAGCTGQQNPTCCCGTTMTRVDTANSASG